MVFVKRRPFFWVSILFACVWFCIPFFKQTDIGYSTRDFNEDMSKLYYDLGALSQRRGDFEKAIKSYTLALDHNPESSICWENLEFCKKKLKYKIHETSDFFCSVFR
jgi:tetratricopeptide (TPR) repeat protein